MENVLVSALSESIRSCIHSLMADHSFNVYYVPNPVKDTVGEFVEEN